MGSRVREGEVCDVHLQRRHSWSNYYLPPLWYEDSVDTIKEHLPILKHHPAKITDHWYLSKKTTISGIIVDNTSWVWIFYGSAALTFLWAGLWVIFFYDMPEDDPFITGVFF